MIRPEATPELSRDESGILRSVAYSSIFDYPLTPTELSRGLIQAQLDEHEVVSTFRKSSALQSVIAFEEGFFFLRGRPHTIEQRRRREARTRRLVDANRWILQLVCAIPSTRLVALSGSAAFFNVDGAGAIDLFIVTRGRRIWSTALLILLTTRCLGKRKLVCTNFLISDSRLEIERRDLFSANQLVNLRPLVGRNCHRRLLAANPFATEFYPNSSLPRDPGDFRQPQSLKLLKGVAEWLLWPGPGRLLESLSRALYRRYLQRRSAGWSSPQEVVLEKDVLKLHTESHRRRVLEAYEKRVNELLDEI